ncbi:MAG: hypothetical protein ACR2M0_16155 [Chloroflexia bacterium]
MARWRPSFVHLVVLGTLALCGVGAFAFVHRGDPPAIWRNPPLYPGAQQVAVQDFGEVGRYQPDDTYIYAIKIVTFTTTDKPKQVLDFYGNAYSAWDLHADNWGNILPAKDALHFSWSSSAVSPPSVYFVNVSAEASPEGTTHVEIGVSMFPGY